MRLVTIPLLGCLLLAASAPAGEPAGPEGLAALAAKAARGDQGLGVVLGDADGRLTAALAKGGRMYVQALARDRERAEKLRLALLESGPAERASAVWQRTAHLPFLDNLVNLAVVSGWGGADLKGLTLDDLVRVLCPGGVAVVGADAGADAAALLAEAGKVKLAKAEKLERAGAWIRIVKQMDPDFGEWPGFMAGPGLTMVTADRAVAPGKEIRWHNGPLWSVASYGNETIAGGRTFHQEREWVRHDGSEFGVGQWVLVARDAFNGCDLWREKFGEPERRTSYNPALSLCADDRRVFQREGRDLVARDAATGRIVKNYGPCSGSVVTVLGDYLVASGDGVAVINKDTGKKLEVRRTPAPPPCPSAAKDGVVYMPNSDGVEAIAIPDGQTLWKKAFKEAVPGGMALRSIMCREDTVYVGGSYVDAAKKPWQVLIAMDRANGSVRWTDVRTPGPMQEKLWEIFPLQDRVCLTALSVKTDKRDVYESEHVILDAKTGKEIKTFRTPRVSSRCYPMRATDRFLVAGDGNFVDLTAFTMASKLGVRTSCYTGQFLAYGLEYDTPHACSCDVALRGVAALSPGSRIPRGEVAPALIKGSAAASGPAAGPGDWPTYRSDVARSNACAGDLPTELKLLWSAKLGSGPIPQATGAGGLIFVAEPERQRVCALALDTGKEKWSFAAEGRVPLPPTYHRGMCLFGDNAGWVYCLDAASGGLVWQLQAAPEQRHMGAFNRFESSWPVKSGVLVVNDVAYFVAGRCGTMDGGLYLCGVDPAGGQERLRRSFADRRPTDILVSDGKILLFGDTGVPLADGAGKPGNGPVLKRMLRSYWGCSLLDSLGSLESGQISQRKAAPGDDRVRGELVAFDQDRSVASGRYLRSFTSSITLKPPLSFPNDGHGRVICRGASAWVNADTGRQMQALLLAGPRAYCAGVPEFRDSQDKPALFVLSATDGKELQRLPLEVAPAIDGLSAIGGRLILTTGDGQVMCFDKK
jgi:outer membrane protein assembly factor BamB